MPGAQRTVELINNPLRESSCRSRRLIPTSLIQLPSIQASQSAILWRYSFVAPPAVLKSSKILNLSIAPRRASHLRAVDNGSPKNLTVSTNSLWLSVWRSAGARSMRALTDCHFLNF
jgi:hypothetical protein